MEINFLGRWFFGCLVIGLGVAVVPADPIPAAHQISLAGQVDLLASRHGEPLEQQSIVKQSKRDYDDNGPMEDILGPVGDTNDSGCNDLRYGPTTPGGQAQLTTSWLVCIPSSLFLSRLVKLMY